MAAADRWEPFGAELQCFVSADDEPWQKGRVSLHRPDDAGEQVAVYEFSLEVCPGNGEARHWRLNDLYYVRRFDQPVETAGCCAGLLGTPAPLMPALVGLSVRSYGGVLRLAVATADIVASSRMRLLHAWICFALEEHDEGYAEHAATPHAWASGIEVQWPLSTREESLRHLASEHFGVNLCDVRALAGRAPFAGLECPVCLDAWDTMAEGALGVALSCGHACCELCLDKVAALGRFCCPTCRATVGHEDSDAKAGGDQGVSE